MKAKTVLALSFIRDFVFQLPEVNEKPCHGTPGFYVGKCLFARLKEGEEELVVYTTERETWMDLDPHTFYITPHYENYKYMLVNLDRVKPEELKQLLHFAWKGRASKRARSLDPYAGS